MPRAAKRKAPVAETIVSTPPDIKPGNRVRVLNSNPKNQNIWGVEVEVVSHIRANGTASIRLPEGKLFAIQATELEPVDKADTSAIEAEEVNANPISDVQEGDRVRGLSLEKEPLEGIVTSIGKKYAVLNGDSKTSVWLESIEILEPASEVKKVPWTYIPRFLSQKHADQWLEHSQKIDWQHNNIRMFGKEISLPRLEAILGDGDYAYSGVTLKAQPWTDEFSALKEWVEKESSYSFQIAIGNQYRDGSDHIGWHSDDSPEMGERPAIASLSLGATRKFQLRHKQTKEVHTIELTHGSLLIMHPGCQEEYQHRICKTSGAAGLRINWTFRPLVAAEVGQASQTTSNQEAVSSNPWTEWTYSTPIPITRLDGQDQPIEALAIASNHKFVTNRAGDEETKTPIARVVQWRFAGKRGDTVKILAVEDDLPESLIGETATVLTPMKATVEVEVKGNAYSIPIRFLDLVAAPTSQSPTPPPDRLPQPILMRQEMDIAAIRIDGGTQIRVGGLDIETVDRYTQLWADLGDDCPLSPLKLMYDGENHWLFDGFHTREAAVKAGRSTAFVDVYEGTLEDARWAACFIQMERGLSLTASDRRRAISQAVKMNGDRTPPLSQRALARMLGVGRFTVRYHYDKLVESGELAPSADIAVERGDSTYVLKKAEHTFEQLAELYKPLGKFQKTSDRRRPFELERPGLSKFFRSLEDAFNQYNVLSQQLPPVSEIDQSKQGNASNVIPMHRDYGKEFTNISTEPESEPEDEDVSGLKQPDAEVSDRRWPGGSFSPQVIAEPDERELFIPHPAGIIASAESCEHYTPQPIWQAALETFGVTQFDLDPATYRESPIPCKQIYTKAEDGLAQDWKANTLWSNFPYSDRGDDGKRQIVMHKWVRKLVESYDSGDVSRAITLVKSDCRTEWFQELLDYSTAFCFIRKAVKFIRPDGIESKGGSFFGSIVFYLGGEVDKFYHAFSPLGSVCQDINPEMFGE